MNPLIISSDNDILLKKDYHTGSFVHMVFSSLIFLFFFLPSVLACYYLVPEKYIRLRNCVLLVFSLGFYFYGEPRRIWIMFLSIFINYVFGLLMRCKYRKPLLALCIACNLGILGLFKYTDFFLTASNYFLGTHFGLTGLIMPIGISFFTFQALSYVIDVYRSEAQPQKNLLSLGLYISMFPQLIAGPIVRYKDVNDQLLSRVHSFESFSNGIDRFICGLAKKVLLSNVFARIADTIFNMRPEFIGCPLAWFGAVSYTLQIYFDFSGYSDMAIGLGKMFGIRFLENFNFPYISRSITEFWRRWHISLSTWFRDYIYIPLGGNRCSPLRHTANIMAVWMLTGLWHGANYTFICWGMYFGIILLIEKKWLLALLERIPAPLAHLYALILIVAGWVFFRSDSLSYAIGYFKAMFSFDFLQIRFLIEYIHRYYMYFVLGAICSTPASRHLAKLKWCRKLAPVGSAALFILCIMSLASNSYNPFIYFRF